MFIHFLKRILRNFLPPIIFKIRNVLNKKYFRKSLFDGKNQLFKYALKDVEVYGEYGCGESTIYVAKNYNCQVMSIDSSIEWIRNVKDKCKNLSKVKLHHANIGIIENWGRPINYKNSENFPDYTDWLWQQKVQPDVVLIDGRFRVCCFLTCIFYARSGTKIIFDDYNRERYHFVERFILPTKINQRQALFITNGSSSFDANELRKAIEQFRFVLD